MSMDNTGRNLLFAFILVGFVIPTTSAGLVEIYIDDSDDLVTWEEETPFTVQQGKDFILTFQLSGIYRIDKNLAEYDENFSVHGINMDVHFLSDTDRRDTCTMCAIPEYKSWKSSGSGEDPGYDTYEARFRGDSPIFEGYSGDLQFSVVMTNKTGNILTAPVLDITMTSTPSGGGVSSGFSIPELPPVVQENLIYIAGGLLAIILLSVGIYTFVLAPEDTTAELYKEKEYVDPLSKSLTGVGYESDLPGEEEEDEEDDEELLDDEEEEFDESKLLAQLTGSQKMQADDEEEKDEPEPPKPEPKKAVKKKVVKKAVSKKVVRKATPPKDAPSKPMVNMGAGIISLTCPSCDKVHNIDEETTKFICGCGRRIRVS